MHEGPDDARTGRPALDVTALEAARSRPHVLLTIAGFDPTSGAGLSADLKVFAAHRMYGVAAATALTVQSTVRVERVEPVSSELLADTLRCLADDLPIAGVKIGMLATSGNVRAVAAFLRSLQAGAGRPVPIVLDPVLRSSSGHALLAPEALACLRAELLPLVRWVTPNTAELLLLAGEDPEQSLATDAAAYGAADVVDAAARLRMQFPGLTVAATGGHLAAPDDYILAPGQEPAWIRGSWVHTTATHGTGCAYSSALLCGLVEGLSVVEAARAAKQYVSGALRAAEPMGQGGGSMHHLYAAYRSHSSARDVPGGLERCVDEPEGNRCRENCMQAEGDLGSK